MGADRSKGTLTGSLEDYLETIYLLLQERRVARVRDIAKARDVKAGSVTPALKRLAELGLIEYEQREYIDLTPEGQDAARRVFARHQLLTRFFHEVLQMSAEAADAEACKLEHSLSNEGMDQLVRFFEFLALCPHRPPALLAAFHACGVVHGDETSCDAACPLVPRTDPPAPAGQATTASRASSSAQRTAAVRPRNQPGPLTSGQTVYDLSPGDRARITHIGGNTTVRQRLLDLGVLPDAEVELLRLTPGGSTVWIKLQGAELALRKTEAKAVLVAPC